MKIKNILKKIPIFTSVFVPIFLAAILTWSTYIKPKIMLKELEKSMEVSYVEPGTAVPPEYWSEYKDLVERVLEIAKEKDYKKVIEELKTPAEASIYCVEILGKKYDKLSRNGALRYLSYLVPYNFKEIHKYKVGLCGHAVVAAAAILSDDNFNPYILVLQNPKDKEKVYHAVLVYKDQDGKFGSIGLNKEDNCPPIADGLEELIRYISPDYKFVYGSRVKDFYPNFIDGKK